MRTAEILFTGDRADPRTAEARADDTREPVVANARRSDAAASHRPNYFKHKIILASIERRADACRERRKRVAETASNCRLSLLHKRTQRSRLRATMQTFLRNRGVDVLTFRRKIL
jgi:hypothetical protein